MALGFSVSCVPYIVGLGEGTWGWNAMENMGWVSCHWRSVSSLLPTRDILGTINLLLGQHCWGAFSGEEAGGISPGFARHMTNPQQRSPQMWGESEDSAFLTWLLWGLGKILQARGACPQCCACTDGTGTVGEGGIQSSG